MVFNSLVFVLFLSLVLFLHNLPFSWRTKKINLVILSYVFYAWWNPPMVLLLMCSTVVDWFAAKGIYGAKTPLKRRAWLAATLGFNLGMLGYFKYGKFLLVSFAQMVSAMGGHYSAPEADIVLPIGISFYTFVTLSYTLDVYWGRMKPGNSFLDYALLVTFFPHLVAGPILRASSFLEQCEQPRAASGREFSWGMWLLVMGLFEKVVLADWVFAPAANLVFNSASAPGFVDSWLGSLAFSGQIFCDFAGYSTCAIGVAMCLGFSLPQNFRFPYAATGFSDFWRRWHISLSTWLRDYVYIPLGGNRGGHYRTYGNLMLTMLIGGLWHVASWTYVAWGALHGIYLAGERALIGRSDGSSGFWNSVPARFLLTMGTFLTVTATWVFFRAHTFQRAFEILSSMANHPPTGASTRLLSLTDSVTVLLFLLLVLASHWFFRERDVEKFVSRAPWWTVSLAASLMLVAVSLARGNSNAFIYFQF